MEPADPIDRMDPTDPMDRIDPADPMDRMEPVEPIESADPTEPMLRQLATDQREPAENVPSTPASALMRKPLP
jgi:hypothetical protein